jgi:hypothetical protein
MMIDPKPLNLMTDAEMLLSRWDAWARDTDGHIVSHYALEADDETCHGDKLSFYRWVEERRGHTVTVRPF